MSSAHPMLQEIRPLIPTRPAERLADACALALEKGSSGMLCHGDGRVGKTKAGEILTSRLDWRPWPMFTYQMNYSKPSKGSSESYFFNSALNATNQKPMTSGIGTNVLARLKNHLLRGAFQANVRIIFLVINEANRFGVDEYNHLVSLQNDIESAGKRLFVLLLSQNDADPDGPQGIFQTFPRQIDSRFRSTKHHYTGLLWTKPDDELQNGLEDDVHLALQQYDIGVLHNGIPCSRWFAQSARESGWTLCSQLKDYRDEIVELRIKNNLPDLGPWPMETFEVYVYYLLVRVAGENPGFRGFKPRDIQEALKYSGYLAWELNRTPEQGP